MKLVERVMSNISPEKIDTIASSVGLSSQDINSLVGAMIPGVLSAVKARVVSGMNSGDPSSILSMFSDKQENFNPQNLFDGNSQAMDTLYHRISEFTGLDHNTVVSAVPYLMPTLQSAVTGMLQEYGLGSVISKGTNFMSDFLSSNTGYEGAIQAANSFLGSVFGNNAAEKTAPSEASVTSEPNAIVQNLFDLFDQDNDGSVMDDIYRMLVR